MYSGDNPSALRSREQIVNAMLVLLNKIPYNQINISTLAKQAKISRQTFYKIFDSQEQVLQFKLDSIYQVYYSKLKHKKKNILRQIL
ncbi:TetR/AcrR family transcriptional regulator [Lactiplantibacillus plantarum]|nr:TetR/AcrR family transcriptional regulator [Lactiplantibacillus plantarum]MBS0945553.1 TetR/AcrR family transcriptional regulator [Lactiplantibacillus plantarum]